LTDGCHSCDQLAGTPHVAIGWTVMVFPVVLPLGPSEDLDTYFPVLSQALEVMPDSADGSQSEQLLVANMITVERQAGDRWTRAVHADDIKLELRLTAGRVVFFCKKWTSGGFIGSADPLGLVVAAVTATVSAAAAAKRRKGTALAGHLRYEWIRSVGWTAQGWSTINGIYLLIEDRSSEPAALTRVTVKFKAVRSSQAIAWDIAQRVIAQRVAASAHDPGALADLERTVHAGPSPKVGGAISWVELPGSVAVG